MSINLDALVAPLPTRQTRPCAIARLTHQLPEVYATAVQDMLGNASITTQLIADRLREAGLPGSHSSISRHRHEQCCCYAGGAR